MRFLKATATVKTFIKKMVQITLASSRGEMRANASL